MYFWLYVYLCRWVVYTSETLVSAAIRSVKTFSDGNYNSVATRYGTDEVQEVQEATAKKKTKKTLGLN